MDSSASVPSPNSLPSNPDMEIEEIQIPPASPALATSQDHQPAQNPPVPPLDHALLDDLEKENKAERKNVELYRARCTADKKELYNLVGFYSVFQGVVFSAVANSARSILTCQTSLLPALLSLLVSVATAISVHYKLRDYEKDRRKLIKSQNLVEFAKGRVTLVKNNMFDFTDIQKKLKEEKQRKLQQVTRSRRNFYRVVMLFLFLFSVTIMACCVLIRCWEFDQAQSNLMLCAFTVCWERNVTVSIHKF